MPQRSWLFVSPCVTTQNQPMLHATSMPSQQPPLLYTGLTTKQMVTGQFGLQDQKPAAARTLSRSFCCQLHSLEQIQYHLSLQVIQTFAVMTKGHTSHCPLFSPPSVKKPPNTFCFDPTSAGQCHLFPLRGSTKRKRLCPIFLQKTLNHNFRR